MGHDFPVSVHVNTRLICLPEALFRMTKANQEEQGVWWFW